VPGNVISPKKGVDGMAISRVLSVRAVARDLLIIVALSGIAGLYTSLAMPGKLGTSEYASLSSALSLVLTTAGFALIGCRAPERRWAQLLLVGLLAWMVGLINIPLFGITFVSWAKTSVHISTVLLIGGAFSYLLYPRTAVRPHDS
jgi:hypothetical protein